MKNTKKSDKFKNIYILSCHPMDHIILEGLWPFQDNEIQTMAKHKTKPKF